MNGMSEQLGPWLGVTEMPHSSLKPVDKPDSAEQLLSADFISGSGGRGGRRWVGKLKVSTWAVLSAQKAYTISRSK